MLLIQALLGGDTAACLARQRWRWCRRGRWKGPTSHRSGLCGTPGANPMLEEATDELVGGQGHSPPAWILGVLIAEAHLALLDREEAWLVSAAVHTWPEVEVQVSPAVTSPARASAPLCP